MKKILIWTFSILLLFVIGFILLAIDYVRNDPKFRCMDIGYCWDKKNEICLKEHLSGKPFCDKLNSDQK